MNKSWTDLNLSSLKYFCDTVKLNSITKSAELNHISRPAVSQAIRRIEDHLGYSLLEHKKRHLLLTDEGKLFYSKATQAIEVFSKTMSEKTSEQISFDIACSTTIAEHVVLPALHKLNLVDQIKLNIKIGTTAKIRQLVSDGESQLGLLIDDEKTFGFETELIKTGEFEFQSRTGLLELPLVTTEFRPEVNTALKALSKKPRSKSFSHIQIESWTVCRKMAELSGGSCLVPDLIPRKSFKKINIGTFKYHYHLLAIAKRKSGLSILNKLRYFKC